MNCSHKSLHLDRIPIGTGLLAVPIGLDAGVLTQINFFLTDLQVNLEAPLPLVRLSFVHLEPAFAAA
jgi:hypothetical protein